MSDSEETEKGSVSANTEEILHCSDEASANTEEPLHCSDEASANTEEPLHCSDEASEDIQCKATENVQDLLAEIESLRDKVLRAEAEMQNVRRRADRDVENAHKFGLERLVQQILPVVDSLEKALEAKTNQDDPVIQGVELTFKLLQDLMSKESINVIDPLGEPFDPNLHEAMSMIENRELEPNSVFAVVQKGYTLNERLVRPAMVMVTKAPNEE